jgi:DNA-binding IclR family transcriptional regulator
LREPGPPKRIQSVNKAIALLRALSGSETCSLSELAQAIGVHPSTAHHLVQTLAAERFVSQDPATRRYALGPALLTILSPSDRLSMLTRILREPMTACAAAIGLDVWAAVLQDDRVHYVARVPAHHPSRIEVPLLSTHPAFCVSPGRVLLSTFDRPTVLEILSHHPLKQYTPVTRTDLAEILEAIDRARVDGYSEVAGEHLPGTRDVAVPVRGEGGIVIAALSVGDKSEMFSEERRQPVLTALQAAACRAEAALGGVSPTAPRR